MLQKFTKIVQCEIYNCTNSIKREKIFFRVAYIYRIRLCVNLLMGMLWWWSSGLFKQKLIRYDAYEHIRGNFYIRNLTLKHVTSHRSLPLVTMQEQLLEEQQQEIEILRLAKLREIEKKKKLSERQFRGKNLREHSIFYTTCVLAFFSVSAGSSILFLVPLYVGKCISFSSHIAYFRRKKNLDVRSTLV